MKLNEILLLERHGTPIAFIMMGLPGSGKSTWAKANTPGFVKYVDPDEINAREFGATPDKYQGTLRKASARSYERFKQYVKQRKSVTLDGTGSRLETVREMFYTAKEAGYDVYLVFIDVDAATAIQQAKQRHAEGGRYMPAKVIVDMEKKIQQTFATAKSLPWKKVYHVKRPAVGKEYVDN